MSLAILGGKGRAKRLPAASSAQEKTGLPDSSCATTFQRIGSDESAVSPLHDAKKAAPSTTAARVTTSGFGVVI